MSACCSDYPFCSHEGSVGAMKARKLLRAIYGNEFVDSNGDIIDPAGLSVRPLHIAHDKPIEFMHVPKSVDVDFSVKTPTPAVIVIVPDHEQDEIVLAELLMRDSSLHPEAVGFYTPREFWVANTKAVLMTGERVFGACLEVAQDFKGHLEKVSKELEAYRPISFEKSKKELRQRKDHFKNLSRYHGRR